MKNAVEELARIIEDYEKEFFRSQNMNLMPNRSRRNGPKKKY
ncbi:hypothetical protein ACWA2B_14190 [Paenibacillus sp. CMM36]